jgi:hypothetical protein
VPDVGRKIDAALISHAESSKVHRTQLDEGGRRPTLCGVRMSVPVPAPVPVWLAALAFAVVQLLIDVSGCRTIRASTACDARRTRTN